jgi:protein translocase SecG subunit
VLEIIQDVLSVLIWILSPLLVILILLQGGAGDVGSAFGGGGQLDSTLGVGANRKMAKITGWLCFGFLVAILILAIRTGPTFQTAGAPVVPEDQTAVPAAGDGSVMTTTEPPVETVDGSTPTEVVPAEAAFEVPVEALPVDVTPVEDTETPAVETPVGEAPAVETETPAVETEAPVEGSAGGVGFGVEEEDDAAAPTETPEAPAP